MFKIVLTVEPGNERPSLCVVPASWERMNVLSWPKTKNVSILSALLKNPKSLPGADWSHQLCVKKRDGFLTYSAAKDEMNEMAKRDDTDAEETENRHLNKKRIQIGRLPQDDFNELATDLAAVQMQEQVEPQRETLFKVHEPSKKNRKNIASLNKNISLDEIELNGSRIITSERDTQNNQTQVFYVNQDDGSLALETDEAIGYSDSNTSLLNTILSNQEKILKELAVQRTLLDILCNKTKNDQTLAQSSASSSVPKILPINSVEKFEQFEKDLENQTFRNELIEKMTMVCGDNGKKDGINCSYVLIDIFFDRNFLTKYTWAGGSRNAEQKLCFKIHTNVIKTFHEIVRRADSAFTEMDCEQFLKGVIKNAKRRASLLLNPVIKRRTSTKKNRTCSTKTIQQLYNMDSNNNKDSSSLEINNAVLTCLSGEEDIDRNEII